MQTYKHYEVDVTKQIIDTPFTETLRKNNVDFTELPFVSHHVVTYSSDEVCRYALIVPLNRPSDYAESVYITNRIPDDADWNKLRLDIGSI